MFLSDKSKNAMMDVVLIENSICAHWLAKPLTLDTEVTSRPAWVRRSVSNETPGEIWDLILAFRSLFVIGIRRILSLCRWLMVESLSGGSVKLFVRLNQAEIKLAVEAYFRFFITDSRSKKRERSDKNSEDEIHVSVPRHELGDSRLWH